MCLGTAIKYMGTTYHHYIGSVNIERRTFLRVDPISFRVTINMLKFYCMISKYLKHSIMLPPRYKLIRNVETL